jgi:hypothetical protein
MVSSHWYNIDPECRLLARFYPMRMKPSWIVPVDCISAQQHKFTHKYGECFYWVEQQNEFAWKIYTVCFHVGQMLFAGNKYLLLKRITVWKRWALKIETFLGLEMAKELPQTKSKRHIKTGTTVIYVHEFFCSCVL